MTLTQTNDATDTSGATEPEAFPGANEFRATCRAFLAEHAVPAGKTSFEQDKVFLQAAVDAGLGGIVYPKEYGGAGLTPAHDKIWREEKAAYPPQDGEFIISHGMCLPMMAEHGTPEQKARFMPDMIAGRTLWCQMFSEPGAGSDVASLQSKAERDGDEWILNGQKVWTTLAHKSEYGLVVVRTDPNQIKHAGISMFILDMKAPGVEIRPIHQIDGGNHFNEVFFTDVRVPADWLLGDLNNGWNLATSMLMYERVAIGSAGAGKVSQPYYDLLASIATANGKIADPVVRDQLMKLYIMESTKSLVAMRTRAEMKAGKTPGPGGSLGKLMGSNISWYYRGIALEIAGPVSVAWDAPGGGSLNRQLLNTFQNGIAGGTDEIQRNIIGDRVLGLPREPSVDTKVPFKDLKVGTQRQPG
ncbi:MAG: putative acyl-CoA dehydrogenase [Ilumatobacteraceae bacterium]|nr:putative acyl-CoA dehydrogenase [Ilumatobacteraceae bacterium]